MLHPFDKLLETHSGTALRPERRWVRTTRWGEGTGCDSGAGLSSETFGDVAPFLDSTERVGLLNNRRLIEWSDEEIEARRSAILAAHIREESVSELASRWLQAIQGRVGLPELRTRVGMTFWSSSSRRDRQAYAERAIRNVLPTSGVWANWNSLNFWAPPRAEATQAGDTGGIRTGSGEKMPYSLSGFSSSIFNEPFEEWGTSVTPTTETSETPEGCPSLALDTTINWCRNRAIVWRNPRESQTGERQPGSPNESTSTDSIFVEPFENWLSSDTQVDLYGSEQGSVTIEFAINARNPSEGVESGVILHIPASISPNQTIESPARYGYYIVLVPEHMAPAYNLSFEEVGEDGLWTEGYRLMLLSEQTLRDNLTTAELNGPDPINVFLQQHAGISGQFEWSDDGVFITDVLLQRGRWHHCSLTWDINSYQVRLLVDDRVAWEQIFDSEPDNLFWWPRGIDTAPEFLALGARWGGVPQDVALQFSWHDGVDPTTYNHALEPDNLWTDPLNAEIALVRAWGQPLSREQLNRRKRGLLQDDPLERALLWAPSLAHRNDSPPRPRARSRRANSPVASMGLPYTSRTEVDPVNREVAWEDGSSVLNLDSFLRDDATGLWGIGCGSLSERILLPESAWSTNALAELKDSDLWFVLAGVRNSAILPCDWFDGRPNQRVTRERWDNVEPYLRTGFVGAGDEAVPSVLLGARNVLPPDFQFGATTSLNKDDFNNGIATRRTALEALPDQTLRYPLGNRVVERLGAFGGRWCVFYSIPQVFFGERVSEERFSMLSHRQLEWFSRTITLGWQWAIAPANIVSSFYGDPEITEVPSSGTMRAEWIESLEQGGVRLYLDALNDNPRTWRWVLRVASTKGGWLARQERIAPEDDTVNEWAAPVTGESWVVGSLDSAWGVGSLDHPAFWQFGSTHVDVRLTGERRLQTNEWLIPMGQGEWESVNPSYVPAYSEQAALPQLNNVPMMRDDNTVAVTDVLLYDRNLNVVAKARTAQPIYRVPSDNLAWKLKVDF